MVIIKINTIVKIRLAFTIQHCTNQPLFLGKTMDISSLLHNGRFLPFPVNKNAYFSKLWNSNSVPKKN